MSANDWNCGRCKQDFVLCKCPDPICERKDGTVQGWIGVDLDGTLAEYNGWKGQDHIGDPVPLMEKRVREWIKAGKKVKIFTARASTPENIPVIKAWLEKWMFPPLEITNVKDYGMTELWDDRAVQVIRNTGERVGND